MSSVRGFPGRSHRLLPFDRLKRSSFALILRFDERTFRSRLPTFRHIGSENPPTHSLEETSERPLRTFWRGFCGSIDCRSLQAGRVADVYSGPRPQFEEETIGK